MRHTWLVLVAVLVGAQPRVSSGRVEVAAVGSNLAAQVRGFAGPSWVGYAVEAVAAHRGYCTSENGVADGTAFLEGERAAHILLRVDKGQVERVRVLSPSCTLDVDALTLHWLTGVRAVESVAFLKSVKGGVGAIAAHADPSADAFLKETAESTAATQGDRQRAAYALTKVVLEKQSYAIDNGALYHATHGLHMYQTRVFGTPGPPGLTMPLPPKK